MKVAIIGGGAIGCVTGAMLMDSGHDVTLVCRRDNAEKINANGLDIDGFVSRHYKIRASDSLDFRPDAAIIAVKTQDVEEAARAVRPYADGAVIVTMQNGVKGDELAAGVLGRDRVVSSVVMFGATYVEPGRVTYNFPAGGLVVGKAFGETDAGALSDARALLCGSFDITVADDIHAAHRTKLILNLSNALAGILGTTLQDTFSDGRVCALGVMLMKEAREAMDAAGLKIGPLPDLPVEKLDSLLGAPLEVSAGIYGKIMTDLSPTPLPGSILQSIRRGRKTEVDYLNGEIAVLGLLNRFPTPMNVMAVKLVREVEATGRFIDVERLLKEMDA